ncbi:TIP41-like family-domain-containing protein [Jimgerdemannia flammicorona]|uniref:TIP41-like family-domain-containing protein n=1 Tax=Jimgerdemannia flammicorona TaxID=994334 RepID=A0A433DEW1_9FUNG|nr:TIP41-like family-domain-containing protein [Jimgerdemannia flammicorona]
MSPPTLPPHEILEEGTPREGKLKGIRYNGWTITSRKAPILNSSEIDIAQAALGIPLPEMIFGNNHLTLEHERGFRLEFRALDALKRVDSTSGSSEMIKVAYAEEWSSKSNANHEDIKDVIKPYDWTYSTDYRGSHAGVVEGQQFESTTESIDIEKLKVPDPILFYEENILYEDELADNGTALLNVRLRVMPSCFFLLQRFLLRVDDVLFRMNDTRVYHEFGSPYVLREYVSREDHYAKIRAQIPPYKGEDISLLTDPNWISAALPPPKKEDVVQEKVGVLPRIVGSATSVV